MDTMNTVDSICQRDIIPILQNNRSIPFALCIAGLQAMFT